MNTKLLLKVRDAILADPTKFRMEWWFQKEPKSPCGTSACIAGHALAITKKWKTLEAGTKYYLDIVGFFGGEEVSQAAARAFGLDGVSADKLFAKDLWPKSFKNRYKRAHTAKQRAKAAADRIDSFIATDGHE